MRLRIFVSCAALSAAVLTVAGCDRRAADHNTKGNRAAQAESPPKDTSPATPTRAGYADVNGARFYYQVYGDLTAPKTPLLVLHGSFMSADAMGPLITPFATTRPVIALDARGHGRTGDLPGPFTYTQLADDATGVLQALNVRSADVLGYSMGGTTALLMAVRHPDQVGKQIIVSGPARRTGWYSEVLEGMAQLKPEALAGTPLEKEYHRLSPTPNDFPKLVAANRALEASAYDSPDESIRAIPGRTMVIVGDADGVSLEYAVELFKLRGGGDRTAAAQGFLSAAPRARLAILPSTSHVGIMGSGPLIAALAIPFLDDVKPTTPPGFFKENP